MEYSRRQMCSRQGVATIHMHPQAFGPPLRRPRGKSVELQDMKQIEQLVESLSKTIQKSVRSRTKEDYFFKAQSREQSEFAERNRTESPAATKYLPDQKMIKPRIDIGVKFNRNVTTPRQRRILISQCQKDNLKCQYPSKDHKSPQKSRRQKYKSDKISISFDSYDKIYMKTEPSSTPYREKISPRLKTALNFEIQRDRPSFVNENAVNQNRFSYMPNDNRKNQVHKFSDYLNRKELFEQRHQVNFYDYNKEQIMPKLSKTILPFNSYGAHKSLALDHQLSNPDTWAIDANAKSLRITRRATHQSPQLERTTARDDLMYRTHDCFIITSPTKSDKSYSKMMDTAWTENLSQKSK